MSSLAKRSAKYFFKEGLKTLGLVLGLECLLIIEWLIIGSDEKSLVEYVLNMFMSVGSIFIIMMNMMYSFYGPNWYDSMALSMGARRKDIFVGELIKQFTFVFGNFIALSLVAVIFQQYKYIILILISCIIAIALGPIGLIVGHKVSKYGKVIIMIIAIIGGVFGASLAIGGFWMKEYVTELSGFTFPLLIVGAIAIFALAELWAYKLNQKSMVK
ncbi:hypothetical protein [Pseudobutyrivibrio ruminis]|uniref:hypothetical protein n=1 Tax=Pseudobutyrivibrio ruminis TaxID=46206 RepID=UPI00040E0809|nr:hypothetical protein [Pseudobutyrivibrio ruminis]